MMWRYKFVEDQSGSTAIEYGLIAALIVTVIIAGITNVSSSTDVMYEKIETTIDDAA